MWTVQIDLPKRRQVVTARPFYHKSIYLDEITQQSSDGLKRELVPRIEFHFFFLVSRSVDVLTIPSVRANEANSNRV
jgi:hypothetical protein